MQFIRGGRRRIFSNYPAASATFFGEPRNFASRGRCNAAASLRSEIPKTKRVSKDERRVLIQSFVTRYKSMNTGKLPSVTVAQKEVGGSYYVVKKILEELEYNSKVCSSNGSCDSISRKTAAGVQDETFTEAMDDKKMLDTNDKQLEAEGVFLVCTLAEEKPQMVSTAVGVQGETCTEAMDDRKILDTNDKQLEADYTLAEETSSDVVLRPQMVSTAVGVLDETCKEAMDDGKMLHTNNKQLEADGVLQVNTLAEETSSEVVLKPQTPSGHSYFALEENCTLESDAKSVEKQVDDKVEDAGMDTSDKFRTVPDKQKMMEASGQHFESEKYCKAGSQGVQSEFGVVEGNILGEETEIGNAKGDEKEQTASKVLLNSGSPDLKAEHHQQSLEEEIYSRNLSSDQSNDAESSKKSTLWGNLKSFANGIINIWRNP